MSLGEVIPLESLFFPLPPCGLTRGEGLILLALASAVELLFLLAPEPEEGPGLPIKARGEAAGVVL